MTDRTELLDSFKLGRYKVLAKLGSGAMGIVFKGHDTELDRDVAIKTIKHGKIDGQAVTQKMLDRFDQEARIAARLSHPNITQIYDIGSEQNVRYFVMECVEGKTLDEIIKSESETYPLIDKLKIISLIARAAHYAHKRDVIHRDIKPANVIVQQNGEPKIMDFGIARIRQNPLEEEEKQGKLIGSPMYMSPEQVRGEPADHRADIFSLGTLAYMFLTYTAPFGGDSIQELLLDIMGNDPAPLGQIDPSLPVALDRAVLTALRKDSAQRYQSAEAFSDEIEMIINSLERSSHATEVNIGAKKDIIKQLKANYLFFADFQDGEILEILKMASKEKYEEGGLIFEEGTAGNRMYIIMEGKVQILRELSGSDSVNMVELGRGDCFGELAIIDSSPHSATARALSPVTLLTISEAVLRVNHPELCLKLYRSLGAIIAESLRRVTKELYKPENEQA